MSTWALKTRFFITYTNFVKKGKEKSIWLIQEFHWWSGAYPNYSGHLPFFVCCSLHGILADHQMAACLAWQIDGHFPSFLRIHWERLEERVITLSSFSLSVDARKEECIHQFPTCHLTLLKCSNQRVPPMVLTSKKSNFFNDSHMKVHKK